MDIISRTASSHVKTLLNRCDMLIIKLLYYIQNSLAVLDYGLYMGEGMP